MKIGIVTGASSGIGREFARGLQDAYTLDELWLIDLQKNQLDDVAADLGEVKGRAIPMDLTSDRDMAALKERLAEEKPDISCLVNSAGCGRVGTRFEDAPPEDTRAMIDLNIDALVWLTHFCLPYIEKGGVIFQMASISGFVPGKDYAVYSGTKAFVLLFSQGLYVELKPRGIHVITVSPGAVATPFWQKAAGKDNAIPKGAASASDVVARAIKDAKKGKVNSTLGFVHNLNLILSRLLNKKFFLDRL